MCPHPGTGPLLAARMARAGDLLSQMYGVQVDCYKHAEGAATLALATGMYGVEAAMVTEQDLLKLETSVLKAVWGPTRRSRAKEVLFAVLMKGHRLSPVMRAQYLSVAGLARAAHTPGTLQVCVQAVWEASGVGHFPWALWGRPGGS